MIKVESLTKRYGRVLAVDDISFEIQKGEVVGLLGPNGAGKSTTMKIMTTFLPATAGKVSIAGHDVFEESLKVRQSIGYLPENCPLYLDMEVEQYLNFTAEIRGLEADARKKAVSRVVSDCSLGKVISKLIGHLSKGYRQRVGLAQALLHNPNILILDEPTSGLDPNQIRDILKLIHDLGQEKTVIHSTHILTEVESTSSRVLIINNGKIVGQGTPKELMAQASGTTIYINVKGEGIKDKLSQTPFVKDSTLIKEESGFSQFAVHGEDEENLAENLFKLSVDNSWVLKELRTETASLDDVFARLTKA